MVKVYTINKDLIFNYKIRNIFRAAKIIGLILLVFFLINLMSTDNEWKPFMITAACLLGLVTFIGILSFFKNERIFESYTIRIENDMVFREGELYHSELINTNIDLSDVENLKKVTNGYLLYKKGNNRLFKFHPYKMVGLYDNDIIWIPFILNNFDELISFLENRIIETRL